MQLLGKEVTLFGLGCAMHLHKTHEILLHNKSLSLQLDQIGGAMYHGLDWGAKQSL